MEKLISNISLTKEQERKINIPKYQILFESNSYYSTMLEQEKTRLIEERKKYSSNMDFYKAVAFQFAKTYIPHIVADYGDKLDENTVLKLSNIINGDGLKIFNPGEAISMGYISRGKNGKPTGDDGAFARSDIGMIGFTPESENSKIDLTEKTQKELDDLVIMNALKMVGSMIHETFHLLIDVRLNEYFCWKENEVEQSQLTSGGFVLNEGLVEKFAAEFSLNHKFVHNPALDYFHYVSLCNVLETNCGKDNFEQMAFNSNYIEILNTSLTPEQVRLYKFHERKKYLEKIGISNVQEIKLDNEYHIIDKTSIKR